MAGHANAEAANREVFWQVLEISKDDRRKLKGHQSAIIWLTGLPASGKTTIAKELEKQLHGDGVHTYILDGDNVRHGLNKDLGFSREDRQENIRRIAETAKLLMDAGIITICAFVSPYEEDRATARNLVDDNEFVEVHVKCPVDVCSQRDPKGLYHKALAGELKGMTGVDDPYEVPASADIVIETDRLTIDESVALIIGYLSQRRLIASPVSDPPSTK